MASSTYEDALARVLAHEGGYSNHPDDPGGPTNYGITIFDVRAYVKSDASAEDVRHLSLAQAKAIYRNKYWDVMRCDDLPAGVDYAVFDYGVNSGVGRAGRVLRRCLGIADDTAKVADVVISAAGKIEPRMLVTRICDERLKFLQGLRTWPVFGKGWGRRVADVKAAALAMSSVQASGV